MEDKSKSILKIIIIVLIVGLIFGIVLFSINRIRKSQNLKDIEKLKDFDITVISYLNLMPPNPSKEASFAFSLNGIDKDSFLNEYEIDSIELNGNKIRNQEIIYEDYSGFRFYSSDYKDDNTIVVIIKNKNTNEKYYKKLNVSTETAM